MTGRSILVLAVFVSVLAVACGSSTPEGIAGFGTATIAIDERSLTVAVADTGVKRSKGLMGVTDLGGLDGMVFVFDSDTVTGFWMKDTPLPLDIAFFDDGGLFVDGFTMKPCLADPCAVYRPVGSYRYAVEAPDGGLDFVRADSVLRLPD